MGNVYDFKACSASLCYSLLTVMQNEASVAIFSKFIFNHPSSSNNVSVRGMRVFWINEGLGP